MGRETELRFRGDDRFHFDLYHASCHAMFVSVSVSVLTVQCHGVSHYCAPTSLHSATKHTAKCNTQRHHPTVPYESTHHDTAQRDRYVMNRID